MRNPFDINKRKIIRVPFHRQKLRTLCRKYFPKNNELAIRINQRLIDISEQKKWRLHPGDEVIITSIVRDPGTYWAVASWLAGYTAPTWAVATVFASLYYGTYLLMRSLGPKPPKLTSDDFSQSFSWYPVTKQQQGLVIPRAYGKNKLYGNIISAWSIPSGLTETTKQLIAFGEGPFEGIVADSIRIQDQPISNYGVTTHERKGTLEQTNTIP